MRLALLCRGVALAAFLGVLSWHGGAAAAPKEIVYITAKLDLPFWSTMGKGVESAALANGYAYSVMDSQLNPQTQLQHARDAIARGVAGIVISPVDSQTAPDTLELARKAGVPVVIADIGTNSGQYVSYIKSDNYRGAYEVGAAVAAALKEKGWQGDPFALVTISLARKNGQDRTNGFRDAMKDAGITHEGGLRQMQNYSAEETSGYVKSLLAATPRLRSIFIETDQPTMGALHTIKAAKRQNELLIGSFDAMPEVAALLKAGPLVACGMQQPYLMGAKAAEALVDSLHGKAPAKQIMVPILVATSKNVEQLMPVANKTVFGIGAR
ncbi:substrate-binding domain-containing protein [Duganella sp. LX20W]|uniref:Substrate-binding domain-containing protein n=2 Tax=Rugamonas brunnea TaxID=2758569 RepID=A0A7W2EW75_9BURK|nr:substrate-binding domain-containing protein [Rugamonas brunnea]